MPFPKERIRNFCIIAHIDHGKSTLADRLLEATGAVPKREMQAQLLDNMDLERERGITIKACAVTVHYKHSSGQIYQFNLIDTPGHVDFSYEVTRSLQACEGALLLVDTTQGVQAQTIANFLLAIDKGLELIPVLNKIDLPASMVDETAVQVEESLGLKVNDCLPASGKSGIGVPAILEAVVERIPAPAGDVNKPLQALVFDSVYDDYRGIIVYIRVVEGRLRVGDKIRFVRSGGTYEVTEIGRFMPKMTSAPEGLDAGEVGYLIAAIKTLQDIKVGDTVSIDGSGVEPLPGFREAVPMVHCSIYPAGDTTYDQLRDSMEKLKLNDSALIFEPESGGALGFGLRCGFLGLLHMDICQERLEREFDLDMVQTAPSVPYVLHGRDGQIIRITSAAEVPEDGWFAIDEPMVKINFMVPSSGIGTVMKLATDRRGQFLRQDYMGRDRCVLTYRMPLAEVVFDLFDRLKSSTAGHGTMDYEMDGYQEADLVKVDVLIHHEPAPALAFICHRQNAERRGRAIIKALKEEIHMHLFEVALQAAIGSRVIARESVKAMRKDVTAKCYGGDVSRKRKLLEKQKKGKKRMKMIGSVEVPQSAFLSVLKVGQGED